MPKRRVGSLTDVLDELSDLAGDFFSSLPDALKENTSPTNGSYINSALKTAAHEAGHVVTAWSSTHVAKLISVTLQGKQSNTSGLTSFTKLDTNADSLWSSTTIHMAGIAAEGIVIGSVRTNTAKPDLLEARRVAEQIAARGNSVAMDIPWAMDFRDHTSTDIGQLFTARPDAVVNGILNACYRKARHVIKQRRASIDALVLALMRKPSLYEHELNDILGLRLGQAASRGSRPIFYLP